MDGDWDVQVVYQTNEVRLLATPQCRPFCFESCAVCSRETRRSRAVVKRGELRPRQVRSDPNDLLTFDYSFTVGEIPPQHHSSTEL